MKSGREKFCCFHIFGGPGTRLPSGSWQRVAVYEMGTPDVGLRGGWAARAQDASTLVKNPAGMSLLSKSELQAGVR